MYFSKRLQTFTLVALTTVALQGQGQGPAPAQDPAAGRGQGRGQGQAQQDPNLPRGTSLKTIIPGKVYFLGSNGFGTSAIVIGDTGVIVYDPGVDEDWGKKIVNLVATLTPKPITHVIESHSDCDHVNGIVGFPTSVKVIATTQNAIEQGQTLRFGTVETQGVGNGMPPADRPPNMLINQEKVDTRIDGVHMVFYHWAPAHTNGDLAVYLPDLKMVLAGDLLMVPQPGPNGLPPQQHGMWWKFEKSGSIAGWLKSADGLLGLNADTYLPGHGMTTFSKDDVRKLRDDLAADKAKVDSMADSGKSLADIQTAFNDQAYPLRSVLKYDAPPVNCPRGIGYEPFTFLEYHEWLNKHEEFKG